MTHFDSETPINVYPEDRGVSKKQAGKKRRLVLFQLIILAGLIGLVGYGFGTFVLAPAQSPEMPQYIGSLKLARHIEGKEALDAINRLHGTGIALESAFVAEYAAPYGGEHVEVWSGEAGSEAAAADLINRMVKGIERGDSGFTNPRQVKIAGHTVWQADGAGGNFFFYKSLEPATRVVWLTIESKNSLSLLESAVKVF